MASSLPSVVDESLLQCPLCCRPAADPTLLPCLHVFCRTCLEHYVVKRDTAAFDPETCTAPSIPVPSTYSEGIGRTLDDDQKSQKLNSRTTAARQLVYGAASKGDKVSRQASIGDVLPPAPPVPAAAVAANSRSAAAASVCRSGSEEEPESGYEVPNDLQPHDDNTYEDVDNDTDDQTYVNSCQQMAALSGPGLDSRKIERGSLGYVSMGTRRLALSAQVGVVRQYCYQWIRFTNVNKPFECSMLCTCNERAK